MSERRSGPAVVASDEGDAKGTAPPPNVVTAGGGGIAATTTTTTIPGAPSPPVRPAPAGGAPVKTPPNDAKHEKVESSLRPEERKPTETISPDASAADRSHDQSHVGCPSPPHVLEMSHPMGHLQFSVDTTRQMHRLAAKYFYSQNFWILFLPSILISMASSIVSFVGTSDTVDNNRQQTMSTAVGVLSVVSVFAQALSKQLDYSHRAQEHERAADKLDDMLELIKFQILVNSQAGKNDLLSIFEEIQKDYKQVLENCSSLLPIQIQSAFELISSRAHSRIFPPARIERDNDCSSDKFKVNSMLELMVLVNNELFNAFGNSRGWPVLMPTAESVVSNALERLDPHLGGDLTAQHKVLPSNIMQSSCCCWSLC